MGNGSRAMRFPDDRLMGYIHMSERDGPIPFFHGRFTKAGELVGDTPVEEWRLLGEARSSVRVPATSAVLLEVLPEEARDLSPLGDLDAEDLAAVWMGNTHVNDEQLRHLSHLTGLRWLNIENNGDITDAGIAHLAGLHSLESLGAHWTRITGKSLGYLLEMPRLAYLDIWGCAGVPAETVEEFTKGLPRCTVRTDAEGPLHP